MRVVIVDDSAIPARLARLLSEAGVETVVLVGDREAVEDLQVSGPCGRGPSPLRSNLWAAAFVSITQW